MYHRRRLTWPPTQKPPVGARLDMEHPINRGIVGCWLFNEGAGSRCGDIGPYQADGVFSAEVKWGAGGLALAGSGLISCGADARMRPAALTLIATCRTTQGQGSTICTLSSAGYYPSFLVGYNNRSLLYLGSSNFRYFDRSPTDVLDGKWHHLAYVVHGNVETSVNSSLLYADGRPQDVYSTAVTSMQQPKSAVIIGWRQTMYYSGGMSDVRLYSRALTAAEVAQLYAEPYSPDYFEPIGPPATIITPAVVRRHGAPLVGAPGGQVV